MDNISDDKIIYDNATNNGSNNNIVISRTWHNERKRRGYLCGRNGRLSHF